MSAEADRAKLRRLLPQELERLEAAAGDPAASAAEFIRSSPWGAQLLAGLKELDFGR